MARVDSFDFGLFLIPALQEEKNETVERVIKLNTIHTVN